MISEVGVLHSILGVSLGIAALALLCDPRAFGAELFAAALGIVFLINAAGQVHPVGSVCLCRSNDRRNHSRPGSAGAAAPSQRVP